MINLLITIALIVLSIFLINKGMPNTFIFLIFGIIVALGYTIATGESVAAAPSGNKFIDILEAVKETFVSSFASTGLSMLPIYGYSAYMNKISAAPALGKLISAPIAKSKSPYFTGVFIAVLVCGVMRIAIVSAFAIMALFITTLYPALRKAGISRESAMAAIFLGTCFDWGPADFVIAQFASGIPDFSLSGYFVNASIKVVPIVLVIVSALSGFIFQYIDKKSGYSPLEGEDEAQGQAAPEEAVPGFYAILPLLPLIFILLFSPLFNFGLNVSVVASILIALAIVGIVELLRKGKAADRLKDMMSWVSGMGEGFGNLLMMVIAAQFFANMISKLQGFKFLVDTALNAGIGGIVLLLFFGALMFAMCLMMGGGGVVGITLAPSLAGIASATGISMYAAMLPMQMANGLRCVNLGSAAHMQYCSKAASSTSTALLKRLIVPSLLMYILTFIFSAVLL